MKRIPLSVPDSSALTLLDRVSGSGLPRAFEQMMRFERQLEQMLRPTLQVTAHLAEVLRPTLQATAHLTHSALDGLLQAYASPIMQMEAWAEENRAIWGPPILKFLVAFEQVASAAERLRPFTFQMPTQLDFCEEAYWSARQGKPEDKQALIDFTSDYLRMPRADWWRVGSALLRSNWRSAKDPVRYLQRQVSRDANDCDGASRSQARLVYSAPGELRPPATNPWEELESSLALQQAWERSVCDPEVRELVAARMLTDSFEEARGLLGWNRVKFQRIHQRLLRARPELRRILLNA